MKHKKFSESKIVNYFSATENIYKTDAAVDEENFFCGFSISKARSFFAAAAERSCIAHFLEYLYYSFLYTPLSAIGVFLLVFGITSFALKFAVNGSKLSFLYSAESFFIILTVVIAILFLPVRKKLTVLLSQSKFFSVFEFSYDKKIMTTTAADMKFSSGYSTAFFLGVLSGIASVIFEPERILLFAALLLCAVLIINRPECGIMLSVFLIPFADVFLLTVIPTYTFLCLIYKYFRVKRHISFGTDEILLTVCGIIFLFSGIFTLSGKNDFFAVIPIISAIFLYVGIKNLVKSVSVLDNCVKILNASSKILSYAVVIMYLFTIIFGKSYMDVLLEMNVFKTIYLFLSTERSVPIFIVVGFPMTLSFALDASNRRQRTGKIISLSVQAFSVLLYDNIGLTTALVLSAVTVMIFYAEKCVIFLPLVPLGTQGLRFLSDFLPLNANAFFNISSNAAEISEGSVFSVIKDNLLFGIGIGDENFSYCLSEYIKPMAHVPQHAPTSALAVVLALGLPASLFVFALVFRLMVKNLRYAVSQHGLCKRCDTIYAGVMGAEAVFTVLIFSTYIPSYSSALYLLAFILAIGKCAEKCVKCDFIDNTRVRL